MINKEKSCFGSPFSHVLSFHDSFLYMSNFIDIFILVQKIISWKAGESELICLHGGLRFHHIGLILCLGRRREFLLNGIII